MRPMVDRSRQVWSWTWAGVARYRAVSIDLIPIRRRPALALVGLVAPALCLTVGSAAASAGHTSAAAAKSSIGFQTGAPAVATATTRLVSLRSDGRPAKLDSSDPAISTTGRFVV